MWTIGSVFGYGDQKYWRIIAIQPDGIVAVPSHSKSGSEIDEKGCHAHDSVFFYNEDMKDAYPVSRACPVD